MTSESLELNPDVELSHPSFFRDSNTVICLLINELINIWINAEGFWAYERHFQNLTVFSLIQLYYQTDSDYFLITYCEMWDSPTLQYKGQMWRKQLAHEVFHRFLIPVPFSLFVLPRNIVYYYRMGSPLLTKMPFSCSKDSHQVLSVIRYYVISYPTLN